MRVGGETTEVEQSSHEKWADGQPGGREERATAARLIRAKIGCGLTFFFAEALIIQHDD